MDLEYDRKFEEMKKYIPFLESMITRLEKTSTGSANPRQAQLDKIRSLRDLLLDKKKRMKMDNLLKCEQVLINLYTKVEQRDTLPGIQPASEVISPKDKMDLNLARNKLKTVTAKTHDPDTLPEIARASEMEVVCSPGSKEPALFQRRPNKNSLSPTKKSSKEEPPRKSDSKRDYTRVLKSPDRSGRLWSPSNGPPGDQHLFSRRSPTRPSRRYSPSYHKRERKKSYRQDSHGRKSKDLNITLKVPEESLNSLNTKDIVSRIINCSDGDVDIDTLRELRSQILGELKQTGGNEDISDLILRSYKSKKKNKNRSKTKDDVEEGELSDSESEAIENVYGNLVVLEKDKITDTSTNQNKTTEQDQVSRKIQICLVINSDKEETSPVLSKNKPVTENQKICDVTDFEMFDDNVCDNNPTTVSTNNTSVVDKVLSSQEPNTSKSPTKANTMNSKKITTIDEDNVTEKAATVNKSSDSAVIDMNNFDLQDNSNNVIVKEVSKVPEPVPAPVLASAPEPALVPFKVNFYKPIDSDDTEINDSLNIQAASNKSVNKTVPIDKPIEKCADPKEPLIKSIEDKQIVTEESSPEPMEKNTTLSPSLDSTVNKDTDIPLLNEPTVKPAKKDIVCEIDILQALKNEILSETISIPGAEVSAPALHQPKVTKVSNAQELPKKRISIENYKRKVPSNKPSLYVNSSSTSLYKNESMKQSLKLTDKEVERFNLISKIALDDNSDDELDTDLKSPDAADLAPKSPDMVVADDKPVSPPVIIPVDPVKVVVVNSKADVDMRTLPPLPIMSPYPNMMSPFAPSTKIQTKNDVNPEIQMPVSDKPELIRPVPPVDPRVRKEPLMPVPPLPFPNMTPSRNTPNMTPSRTPNMTPNSRSFEVTPSRPFDTDERVRKHVYAPMFTDQGAVEHKSVWEPSECSPRENNWESSNVERDKNPNSRWDDRNSRNNFPQRDDGLRSRYNDPNYEVSHNRSRNDRNRDEFNRQEGSRTNNYYPRQDCPATPTPSFGRGDAPSTPSHYFGRSDCPRTPSHPFGRSDHGNQSFGITEMPLTPNHPFGRSEAPMTPSHPFGRSEPPLTPSHPFGRSEAPSTPSHPFGRSDYSYNNSRKPLDPRLNRSYDNDQNNRRDAGSYYDRYKYNRNDPRNFSREQSVPRNEPKPYTPDQTFNRDKMSRREPSVGRSFSNESDRDRLYTRDRSRGPDNPRSYTEVGSRRNFQRESSASRYMPDHRSRASSVGRNMERDTGKEVSVESHAGRAFTIDTSVNSTFQKFLDSHKSNDSSFNDRRLRASSVGRSLVRESSVGRTLPSNTSHKMEDNRDRFRRAQSVGRDLSNSFEKRAEKSFKDVKAEFESFKYNDRKFQREQPQTTRTKENSTSRDPRLRRESYDKQNDVKHTLNKTQTRESNTTSKKINYRDPRQRREHKLNERDNRNRSDSRDRHSYGISSDSVTKSPVISSVKNYKIPKIKRAPEEKPADPITVEVPTKTETKKASSKPVVKDVKQKSIEPVTKVDERRKHEKKSSSEKQSTKKEDGDEKTKSMCENIAVEASEKRITRRSVRINDEVLSSAQSEDDEIIHTRTRRSKKVIYDTDSDESPSKAKTKVKLVSPKKSPIKKNKNQTIESTKTEEKQEEDTERKVVQDSQKQLQNFEDSQEALDSNFGLDDLELFPDTIITDPVLDNINALIADLDNDLGTAKPGASCTDLFNEINIENMLEKITTSPVKSESKSTNSESGKPVAETVNKSLFDTLINSEGKDDKLAVTDKKNEISENIPEVMDTTVTEIQIDLKTDPQTNKIFQTDEKNYAEPVVSTSVNEEEPSKENKYRQKSIEGHLTPDSTNDAVIPVQNISKTTGPDSTIEKQCEMSSDISSTHDAGDKPIKDNSEVVKEPTSQIESIGSLLSILQDKSKIKELLSMLGDQSSENEKIKKKLEKLSEIVSDDEDTNDNNSNEKTTKIVDTSKDKIAIESAKQNDNQEVVPVMSIDENKILKQKDDELPKSIEKQANKSKDIEQKVQIENDDKEGTSIVSDDTNSIVTNHLELEDHKENENKDEVLDNKATSSSTDINEDVHLEDKQKDHDKDANSEPEDKMDSEDDDTAESVQVTKKMVKKIPKRLKTGKFKKGKVGKPVAREPKRVTRSEAAVLLSKPKPKKVPRELKLLQESIKEMFMSDDILNASGIRMCRLAKMVDEKSSKDDTSVNEPEPIVVLEKVKHFEEKALSLEKSSRKKTGLKQKTRTSVTPDDKDLEEDKILVKYKPGPKSKTKNVQIEKDPYDFETDSINESKSSEKALDNSSDSENESLASSKSFGSTELLVELKKKPKRKRGGWKAGVIKPKNKKRKIDKRADSPPPKPTPEPERKYTIPDFNCFTDKNYCFSKNISEYACRLCESTHSGSDIVFHYKKHHPHSEIPLSRMSPDIAREAIEQCGDIDFRAISKMPTEKYICRFCFKEFAKKRAVLETFFWHVISMHTGEYKQLCSECINVTRCPFNLDIPPPPKDTKGQLIGYICGKCNFTQISLENLKTHVIQRHNDKETEVYTINFAVMTKKTINILMKRCRLDSKPRTTRSTRSNQSYTEVSDDRSEITESEAETTRSDIKSDTAEPGKTGNFFKSKISFENEDNASDMSNIANTESSSVKAEQDDENDNQDDSQMDEPFNEDSGANDESEAAPAVDNSQAASNDIMDYPHFKINYTVAGNKEYICCINGNNNHYKTGLLISMKKHVQLKHSEIWDGYCFVCKVIVTSQGQHKFSECLAHFLDKHIDNFPVLERISEPVEKSSTPLPTPEVSEEKASTPKGYINVRPLDQLLVKSTAFPVIENVISLVPPPLEVEPPRPSPVYPVTQKEIEKPQAYKYEEAQAEIMSRKHTVVLEAMMTPEKLVQVFKCAGRFCSFTSDSPEQALLHASTHQRVGGTNSLLCAYCDFDASGNSIDLVSHVFKNHGRCQFVCGLCFYRAAASQLVGSHVTRVHGMAPEGRVWKSTTAPAVADSTEGNLSRENAVPLYICKQSENEGACTFRTVTHTKFWEHLTNKHEKATEFCCYICNTTCGDATTLVVHLKTHGLKLFHCTLCVYGADNEPELLAHASAKHPAKPPQAYIRTICGQNGNGSFKILPLVELKKFIPPSLEVASSKTTENPAREAERSMELENLIGHVLDAPEPVATPAQAPLATEIPDDSNVIDEALSNLLEDPATVAMATLVPVPPLAPLTMKTPPRAITPASEANISNQLTPVLKQEVVETTPEKIDSDVICLDSDDEDSKQGIISLSDEEPPATVQNPLTLAGLLSKKPDTLYKCGKCGTVTKTSHGFKAHMNSCFKPGDELKCAYCKFTVNDVGGYLTHYTYAHGGTRYNCGICPQTEDSMSAIKRHVKIHKVSKIVVTSTVGEEGQINYVVGGKQDTPVKAKPVKRKSSGSTPAPPPKVAKRYGPADVEKLPINPILEESVYCELCEFNTKVRLNMVRHLQLHAEQQPAPNTAPVNPVPHLETNEKHFDKMVNLASSSINTRAPDKGKEPTPTSMISPDMASRYPKFVPERYRYTCGSTGCTYISVDEGMLRCHWETLHSGTNDFHCVHCPPYQELDKSTPLSANRIIAHIKMHDIQLYACSACPYYHHKRQTVDKHMSEIHKGNGNIVIVREEGAQAAPTTPTAAAPTMDLKAWQCGLCNFKSMLRPEVVEHCSKMHQSKMQYKCAYCPFRTSTPENVTKHQTTSHPNREHEIFYFYYREGSIPHGPDGTPHWQKQRQKTGLNFVKAEADPILPTGAPPILPQIQPQPAQVPVNLNLIKKEIDPDALPNPESVEELCVKYGEFCEPNGLNYKCSLCKVVVEDTKQAMQSHLFEELQYRKWGCRLCSYKAFHQAGLKEHMWTEHRQSQEPRELPVDIGVEAWVSKLLDYQENLIKKNRDKLAQQKMQDERTVAPSTSKTVPQTSEVSKHSMQELETYFGALGTPSNMHFCCPKCQFLTKDDTVMQDHLESELTRIRWCCSNCSSNFSTYHEAQYHCKSVHPGATSRPTEAIRDPFVRSAWVAAAIQVQKLSMNCMPVTQPQETEASDDNSLLTVRYEEDVPTPEEETLRRRQAAADSDDEGLVIDEPAKKTGVQRCPYCDFTTKYIKAIEPHILRHYNLKPYHCPHCNFNNHRNQVLQHMASRHPNQPGVPKRVERPPGPPTVSIVKRGKCPLPVKNAEETIVCLICEKLLTEIDSKSHTHENTTPMFAKRGDIVVKCSECLMLFPEVVDMQVHFTANHPELPINYAYYKTDQDSRGFLFCSHCNRRFSYLIDLKTHHNLVHSALKLKYTNKPYAPGETPDSSNKRKADDATTSPKRFQTGD